jgi:hypothetical protein
VRKRGVGEKERSRLGRGVGEEEEKVSYRSRWERGLSE